MAYIGRTPTVGNFQICDAISVVNGQAAYTMQVGSVNVIPQSSNHMIVSLNGTIQKPGGANPSFTVSGSTITFASNLVTNDVIDFIQILGDVLDLGVPSDATVTTAKLASTSVTAAKLNNDIISGTTALTSEPADTDEFLVSDAGTLKRIDYSLIKGGGVTEIDQWRLTTSFDGSSYLTSNLERVDTAPQGYLGTGMTQSSGVFTFPSTGHWFVKFNINYFGNGDGDIRQAGGTIDATTNNSSYAQLAEGFNGCNNHGANYSMCTEISTILDITDTSNQKVKFQVYTTTSGATCSGSTDNNRTFMTFFKFADT